MVTKELLAVLLWAAMIFSFSSVPNLESGLEQDFIIRKLVHVAEYAILAYLAWNLLRKIRFTERRILMASWTICLFYSVSDEIHQGFVFGRHSSVMDVFIDLIGITSALALISQRRKIKKIIKSPRGGIYSFFFQD